MKQATDYMPQLDGVRAIAILLVIVFHWFPEGVGINFLPNGPIGVTLFFVLSGFLISQILLKNKHQIETQQTDIKQAYRTFVIRRALRIFPVYYLTLFAVFALKHLAFLPQIQTDLYAKPFYYVLYGSNFLITFAHNWADSLSPFWSLAVEEQFYIFFPLVIFFVPRQWLLKTILGFILFGILARIIFRFLGDTEGLLTPSCFDAFGLGALWAYFRVEKQDYKKHIPVFDKLALLGLCLFITAFNLGNDSFFHLCFMRTAISLMSLFLIVHASEGFKGWFGWVLRSYPFQHIGKVSYGLYVFHILVPSILGMLALKVLAKFGIQLRPWGNGFRAISFILLLISANISWRVIEKPINNLKRYFEY